MLLAVLVLLELNIHVHCKCVFTHGSYVKEYFILQHRVMSRYRYEKWLFCSNLKDNFLAYSSDYENLTYFRLYGKFTEIGFVSRYT